MPALLCRAPSVSPGGAFQLFLVLVSTLFSLVWVFGTSSASGVSVSPWQVVASVERLFPLIFYGLRKNTPIFSLFPFWVRPLYPRKGPVRSDDASNASSIFLLVRRYLTITAS